MTKELLTDEQIERFKTIIKNRNESDHEAAWCSAFSYIEMQVAIDKIKALQTENKQLSNEVAGLRGRVFRYSEGEQ